jgi:aarF domain-containing kinase
MWTSYKSSTNASAALKRFVQHRRPLKQTHQGLRFSSSFPRQKSFTPFFTRAKPSRRYFGHRLLWAIPATGGLAFFLSPQQPLLLSTIFASPRLIPIQADKPDDSDESASEVLLTINSPNEEDRSILSRVRKFVIVWIWEPILTARRFAHLFIIFFPVILTAPALLFGEVQPKKGGERKGAIWWYNLLVAALQRAGPTFTKVCEAVFTCPSLCADHCLLILARSVGWESNRLVSCGTLLEDGHSAFKRTSTFYRTHSPSH